MRKSYKLAMLALTAITAANGCSNMNNTQTDALAGGGIGAVLGALVDRRHPGTGAAIGGISGAAIGAAVGHSEDKAEQRAANVAAAQRARALSYEEIVTMAKSGTTDSVIINQIRTSGTRYDLTGEIIIWLQQNNVSEAVIREMQDTARRQPVIVRGEPYYRDPYYYGPVFVAPAPVVGIGVYGRIR
jgi:hypothetical protein